MTVPGYGRSESFVFDFRSGPQPWVAQLESIGCELQRDEWNGPDRVSEDGACLFVYTLSGAGMFEAGDVTKRIGPGQAFVVTLPGEHRYYIPHDEGAWVFLFSVLSGTETKKTFDSIIEEQGHIVDLHPESSVIHYLTELQSMAGKGLIADGYLGSACAYRFNMELLRAVRGQADDGDAWGAAITKAAAFIRGRYTAPLSIEEIAAAVGLSKYHFCKQFRKTTGYTPLDYVTKIRLDNACELLRRTSDSVEKIAQLVGYSSGNYFCKVFRKWTGQSPGSFRSSRGLLGVRQPVSARISRSAQ